MYYSRYDQREILLSYPQFKKKDKEEVPADFCMIRLHFPTNPNKPGLIGQALHRDKLDG